MNLVQAQVCGFGKVNTLLGFSTPTNTGNFVWEDNSVSWKDRCLQPDAVRREKLAELSKRQSCLSFAELQETIDLVFVQYAQLIEELSYAEAEVVLELDNKLNDLIENAVLAAEDQARVESSRRKIEKSRSLYDGWMSVYDVDTMLSLSNKSKFAGPNRCKFVNRGRQ